MTDKKGITNMARLTRKEMDELGAVATRAVKLIDQQLTSTNLQKIFGRLYSKLLKNNKLDDNSVKTHEKTACKVTSLTKKVS